jgi:hypothetical protein
LANSLAIYSVSRDWYVALFFVSGLIVGFAIKSWVSKPCPKPVTIIEVIRDTTEANMYRRMAEFEKRRADSLQNCKQQIKIKYEIIYKYLDASPMPVVDSIIEANRW